jgi:hypothetical protein
MAAEVTIRFGSRGILIEEEVVELDDESPEAVEGLVRGLMLGYVIIWGACDAEVVVRIGSTECSYFVDAREVLKDVLNPEELDKLIDDEEEEEEEVAAELIRAFKEYDERACSGRITRHCKPS